MLNLAARLQKLSFAWYLAGLASVAALSIAAATADSVRGWAFPQPTDRARIVRVIDGDTFVAAIAGKRVRVRLLGVDTPETVKPDTAVQCFGKRASHASKRQLAGERVTLHYDVEHEDKYGRTLAYVEVRGRDYSAWLVRKGYARVLTIAPNEARAESYRRLEDRAQAQRRGLWGSCS